MKTLDISSMIVTYNFFIGVLLMLSSEKISTFAGFINKSRRETIVRFTHVSTFTFGASVAVLSGFIYLAFHVLKVGV